MTSSVEVECALVARIQNGDADAYEELVRMYLDRAYAAAYRVLGHREDAEDAVQDAFLAALEHIGDVEPGRPFGPWFLRLLTNRALNLRKAIAVRHTQPLLEETASIGGERPTPERDAESAEIRNRVMDTLGKLAPRQRLVVMLTDVDGFTPTEVSAMLGLAPGTVRGYLHEARQVLRQALAAWRGGTSRDTSVASSANAGIGVSTGVTP